MANKKRALNPWSDVSGFDLPRASAVSDSLFWKAPIPIYLYDAETLELLECNPAAWRSYGVESLEAFEQVDLWMDPPFSEADAQAWIRRVLNEGPQCYEWCSRDVHGQLFWEELRLLIIPIQGVDRVAVFATDITARKRADSAVLKALGMVAHDLRSPIAGIQALADLVKKDTPPKTLLHYLKLIKNSADGCIDFVEDLLEFSRSDLLIQDRRTVDLAVLLPELTSRLVPAGISVFFDLPSSFSVLGSPSKLSRIFSNLFQNAADALLHSPIEAPCIRVCGKIQRGRVQICVEDNGPGIPKHIRSTIFDPFVTAGKKSGHGLGLPIVRRLAHLHGGDVKLKHSAHGAHFCVYGLPAAENSTGRSA